jgi:hypothetical protein
MGWPRLILFSPHMRKLYGDSLRKDAGFVKVIKSVAEKNIRLLETRAPKIRRVAREVIGTFDKVYEETAEIVEDFLAKCELTVQTFGRSNTNYYQLAQNYQKSCKRLR